MADVGRVETDMQYSGVEGDGMVRVRRRGKRPVAIPDRKEISAISRLVEKVRQLPDVRSELIERVKAEIEAGTYETPERIDIAVERLMSELFLEQ